MNKYAAKFRACDRGCLACSKFNDNKKKELCICGETLCRCIICYCGVIIDKYGVRDNMDCKCNTTIVRFGLCPRYPIAQYENFRGCDRGCLSCSYLQYSIKKELCICEAESCKCFICHCGVIKTMNDSNCKCHSIITPGNCPHFLKT